MTTPAAPTPPGWYPDPQIPGGQRWWDGTQWTQHSSGAAVVLKAPAGTKTDTVWIWILVLLPLLSIGSLFLLNATIEDYMRRIIANPTSPGVALSLYTSPGYLVTLLGSFVLYGVIVVLAWRDFTELTRRLVPKPFHWAWSFLGGVVYAIGRSVVVKRRTGGGLGPLWALIAVYAVSIIASIVWTVTFTQQILSLIPSYPVS